MGCRFALPAITLAMVLGIGWTPTHASDQNRTCSAMSKIAGTTMKARQNSVALETTIQIYSEETTPQAYKYLRPIILKAYEYPAMRTPKHKHHAITEFKNSVMLDCLRLY